MSVVSHATSSSARRGDHWSRTAQMRTDDLHCGITLQMAGSDQLHGGDGVLERCAHHPRDAVFADQRRACPVADWMQIQDRAGPVEFGEDRLEFGIGDRAIEDAGVHRHADMPNSLMARDISAIAASM